MTRETRIGLLVGLLFIVMFGLVLSELTDDSPQPVDRRESVGDEVATTIEHFPSVLRAEPGRVELAAAGRADPVVDSPAQPAHPAQSTAQPTVRSRLLRGAGTSLAAERQLPTSPQTAAGRYVVKPNDSLIRIARKVYGRGQEQQYKLIFQANRGVLADESTLQVGQELVIPPLPQRRARPSEAGQDAPQAGRRQHYQQQDMEQLRRRFGSGDSPPARRSRTYVVRSGDSLTTIAQHMLGDDSRAAVMKIFDANRNKLQSPDRLSVGVELEIPG